jgi:hypothetical protein
MMPDMGETPFAELSAKSLACLGWVKKFYCDLAGPDVRNRHDTNYAGVKRIVSTVTALQNSALTGKEKNRPPEQAGGSFGAAPRFA